MDSTASKITICILGVPLALPFVWLFFWGCNLLVWLMSIGFSLTDPIFASLPSGAHFMKIVGFFVSDCIWIYFAAYFQILIKATESEAGEELSRPTLITFAGLLTLVVIMIYDPRIASYLPAFLERWIHFLQNNWNFHLVGSFSWANFDFSGKVSDPFYYTVFDWGIGLTYLLYSLIGCTKD